MDKLVTMYPICQKNKGKYCNYPSLLDPLHIPDMGWTHLSEGLPKSHWNDVIFMVVDRLTKFTHFIPLPDPFTMQIVAQAFIDNVIRLHGPSIAIVSNKI